MRKNCNNNNVFTVYKFIIEGYLGRPVTDGLNTDLHLDIGNWVSLEKVDKFCYLGDMLAADGGCDSAVTARVRSAW